MNINRRQFNHRLTSALLGLSAIPQLHAQGSQDHPTTYFVDASKDPTRFLPTWELLYDCWLKALSFLTRRSSP